MSKKSRKLFHPLRIKFIRVFWKIPQIKMPCRTKIPISKQFHRKLYPLIYFLRLFGIFPLKVEKTHSGLSLKWSPWYAGYSYLFGLVSIGFLVYGQISHALLKVERTIDIVTLTDVLVTWAVVAGYCLPTFIGTFIIANKFSQLFDFIECLNEVDQTIAAYSIKLTIKRSILLPTFIFSTSASIFFTSTYAYYISVGDVISILQVLLEGYYPLTVNVYVGLMIQCMIRHLANCLESRFVWINEILLKECRKFKTEKGIGLKNIFCVRRWVCRRKITSIITISDDRETNIPKLCLAYQKLLTAATILNNLFGISILIAVVAVFLGFTRSLYYIILLLQGKHSGVPELLLRLSVISHQFCRTLFIIDPFYRCKEKMEATGTFLSDLLSLNIQPLYRKQVNRFAVSVSLLEHKFSACGLFNIDRFLLTSLIDSVTTFIVILLQAEEKEH